MIRAGIDPGSRALGLAIADERRLLHLAVLPVGELQLLAKPRTNKYNNRITTHRHVLPLAGVDALVADIIDTLTRHRVERLLLEWSDSVHIPPDSSSSAASMGTALVRTSIVATSIRSAARAVGIDVVTVSPQTWRAKVARSAGAKGRDILPGLFAGYPDWPTRSRDHEQDAAGAMLWDMLPELVRTRSKAAPRSYVVKGEKTLAAPRDCGCGAKGRHRKGCPLHVPKVHAAAPSGYKGMRTT